jgi:hypothetical protein
VNGAAGGLQVVAAMIRDSFLGRFAQPKSERHWSALEVIVEPAKGMHLGLLDNIRGIDAGSQPAIKPQLHGLPEVAAMAFEQLVECLALAGGDLHEESVGFGGIDKVVVHKILACRFYPRWCDKL